FKVKESEVWKKTKHESWGQLGRSIVSHWKLFIYLTILLMMMNFVSHGTQDMYPTFLERHWGFNPRERVMVTALSMVGAIIGGVIFGFISDRWGRRRSMIVALLCAIAHWDARSAASSLAKLRSANNVQRWRDIPEHH